MYVYTVASDCLCVLFNVVLFIVKNILFTTMCVSFIMLYTFCVCIFVHVDVTLHYSVHISLCTTVYLVCVSVCVPQCISL